MALILVQGVFKLSMFRPSGLFPLGKRLGRKQKRKMIRSRGQRNPLCEEKGPETASDTLMFLDELFRNSEKFICVLGMQVQMDVYPAFKKWIFLVRLVPARCRSKNLIGTDTWFPK